MRSLFRSFERRKVEYLLISGQASILYGAATFSEDIDIWVRPDEVISNLVQVRLAEIESPSREKLRWAALHSFRAEDRVAILERLGRRANVESCRRSIAREIAAHQARDVRYWKPRLEELRALRRAGRLWPEGRPVASLLR